MSDLAPAAPTVEVSLRMLVPVTHPGQLAVSVALATHRIGSEWLTVTGSGGWIAPTVVALGNGTRMHVVDAPPGDLWVEYHALSAAGRPVDQWVTTRDRVIYLRPSRYCRADLFTGYAAGEFGGLEGAGSRVRAVADWINAMVVYVPGATDVNDDALHPLLTRQGVCRDFAHLGITLCRAMGIPARYVSVYAPGLDPMEAHAVFEAEIDGVWRLFDATGLAPRTSMVRIATGRDAADAALLTTLGARTGVPEVELVVTAHPELPLDNGTDLVTLG